MAQSEHAPSLLADDVGASPILRGDAFSPPLAVSRRSRRLRAVVMASNKPRRPSVRPSVRSAETQTTTIAQSWTIVVDADLVMCPITRNPMAWPVLAESGNPYERSALMKLFEWADREGFQPLCAVTRRPLTPGLYFEDFAMRALVTAHVQAYGIPDSWADDMLAKAGQGDLLYVRRYLDMGVPATSTGSLCDHPIYGTCHGVTLAHMVAAASSESLFSLAESLGVGADVRDSLGRTPCDWSSLLLAAIGGDYHREYTTAMSAVEDLEARLARACMVAESVAEEYRAAIAGALVVRRAMGMEATPPVPVPIPPLEIE